MTDVPEKHAGLTFEAWNNTNGHDRWDVERNRAHYLARWRSGGGAMPPSRRPDTIRHRDRYEELD